MQRHVIRRARSSAPVPVVRTRRHGAHRRRRPVVLILTVRGMTRMVIAVRGMLASMDQIHTKRRARLHPRRTECRPCSTTTTSSSRGKAVVQFRWRQERAWGGERNRRSRVHLISAIRRLDAHSPLLVDARPDRQHLPRDTPMPAQGRPSPSSHSNTAPNIIFLRYRIRRVPPYAVRATPRSRADDLQNRSEHGFFQFLLQILLEHGRPGHHRLELTLLLLASLSRGTVRPLRPRWGWQGTQRRWTLVRRPARNTRTRRRERRKRVQPLPIILLLHLEIHLGRLVVIQRLSDTAVQAQAGRRRRRLLATVAVGRAGEVHVEHRVGARSEGRVFGVFFQRHGFLSG